MYSKKLLSSLITSKGTSCVTSPPRSVPFHNMLLTEAKCCSAGSVLNLFHKQIRYLSELAGLDVTGLWIQTKKNASTYYLIKEKNVRHSVVTFLLLSQLQSKLDVLNMQYDRIELIKNMHYMLYTSIAGKVVNRFP